MDVTAIGAWLAREPQVIWNAFRPVIFVVVSPLMILNFWWAAILGPVFWILAAVTMGASRRNRRARLRAGDGSEAPVTTLGRAARSRAVRLVVFVGLMFPVTGMITDVDFGVSTYIGAVLVFDYLTVVLVMTLLTMAADIVRGGRAGTETQLAYAVTLLVLPAVAGMGYAAAWYFAALNYKPPW